MNEPRTVDLLTVALGNQDPGVRRGAIAALGMTKEPPFDLLIPALNDPDSRVRKVTAAALCCGPAPRFKNDPRVVAALLTAFRDRDLAAIAGAHTFFVQRGEPDSEDALIEASTPKATPICLWNLLSATIRS